MPFQLRAWSTAGLLALSSAFPIKAQDATELQALKDVLQKLGENPTPEVACDPFIDPECNTPIGVPAGPDGCTDCAIVPWADYLTDQRGILLNVPDVTAGGKNFVLRENVTNQFLKDLPLGPEVGF